MIDTAGSTMGFFVIENLNPGVKISSIGPNDGNNYTSGYISQINFTDLFVNPNEEGPITFTADINSELGDNVNFIDSSIIINCPSTSIKNINNPNKLIGAFDLLGKELIRENITGRLDISSLESGTYILNLTEGTNTSTHKIIKN